jgi:hypothetical protein
MREVTHQRGMPGAQCEASYEDDSGKGVFHVPQPGGALRWCQQTAARWLRGYVPLAVVQWCTLGH